MQKTLIIQLTCATVSSNLGSLGVLESVAIPLGLQDGRTKRGMGFQAFRLAQHEDRSTNAAFDQRRFFIDAL